MNRPVIGRTLQLTAALLATLCSLCLSAGMQPASGAPRASSLPPLGKAIPFPDGIKAYGVTLKGRTGRIGLYIYLPGRSGFKKLPCVLIAPAGTRMFHGMTLGSGDQPEHLPYVRAGYAVVAYELEGALSENPSPEENVVGAYRFRRAGAGVLDAKAALDYALARIPNIDKNHIFTAGHSSAATVSLEVAARDPRVKGCIAYAPPVDPEDRIGTEYVDYLNEADPGFRNFIHLYSPVNNTTKLRCPVFIFHAADDTNVARGEIYYYVRKLKKTNRNVTHIEVAGGGHYQSMINPGIPYGIGWLNKLMGRKN